MIKVSSLKRSEQRQLSRRARVHVLSTISLTAIFFTYIFTSHTFTSNYSIHPLPMITVSSFHSPVSTNNHTLVVQRLKLTSSSTHKPVHIVQEVTQETVLEDDHNSLSPPISLTRIESVNETLHELDILMSTRLSRRFEKRAREFFRNGCKVRFFMIWISSSPSRVFGDREFLAVDALFKSNPNSCLMILSNTMDSVYGFQILKPFTDHGFRVQAITPDLEFLLKNTPTQSWLHHIKKRKLNPGNIPLAQNLSNLIRLAILYKYGGVYLDTDFIVLKDFSRLHNSIGAQSATRSGNWTRLNNAVLVFEKNHLLLYKFMKEFVSTFNGNKWGYNGPYLVSRVVEREREATAVDLNYRVLPPSAFYPIDWTRIGDYFTPPIDRIHRRWVETKVGQLRRWTYGVHLWNKQSSRLNIEEGSIMARLIPDHCVICKG